jgi:phosphoribosyl-ATP pyrophosphohydrolase
MTDSIDRLHEAVLAARQLDPAESRTSRLLQAGRSKVAKKFGEEAFEVVIDALNGSREALVRESADLLYHLVVLWAATGVSPRDVWKETDRRESLFGIAEKLHKENKARRRLAGGAMRRARKSPRRA